eukprot:scaffold451_cov124-Isochrysis_galbana.AAC.7
MATGNALRREQAAIRRSDRRTHLGDVTAHWATAARGATLTSAWPCLADACTPAPTAKRHHTERCCARARGSERAAPVGAVAARSQAISPTSLINNRI